MSVINTNVKALVAQESMRSNNLKLSSAMERLSTGLRINSAKDDAAGLAISNRMTAQIRGISMAVKNSNDAISMAQTADGAYGQVTSMLQRMRELAVQASTGTMSSDDRASLQLEVKELQAEIDNVSKSTRFNGINLLDGSAQDIRIQTGANQGDTIQIGFDSVKTKDIGSGDKPALTSFGGNATDVGAISSGVLTINGVMVGKSMETDDNLSYLGTSGIASATIVAASAIAKAAAINRVSEFSGVTAKANDTNLVGTTMSSVNTALSGTITINGVATSTITTTTDSQLSRQMVADAINAISGQTGVTATNTGDDKQGVTLNAADGRNITVEFSTLTAASTGVSSSGTFVGTYSLYSMNGSPITIGQGTNVTANELEDSGLRIGTYEADEAVMVTKARTAQSGGTTAAAQPVFAGDTLVVNGIAIGASLATDDTSSVDKSVATASQRAASAIAIAAAINKKTDQHGVTAKAEANVLRGTDFSASTAGATLNLNNVSITIAAYTRNAVIDAINERTGQTGVVASAWGDGIELRAEDGRNIIIASDASAGSLGLTGVTIGSGTSVTAGTVHYASVSLHSSKAFTVARGNEGDNGTSEIEDFGFMVGTFGGKDTGTKVADIDISTQQGAQNAITAIDHAMQDVNNAQARSGAFQNRLDAIVNILQESGENMSASRSRILDTDYATETTALAKAQIVQQAATAMLAQANQQQQSVLALLQ
jgi:flagellin